MTAGTFTGDVRMYRQELLGQVGRGVAGFASGEGHRKRLSLSRTRRMVDAGPDDIGFTLPAQAGTYWVGEAMQTVDFKDLEKVPDPVASANAALARNATHLARALQTNRYPAG